MIKIKIVENMYGIQESYSNGDKTIYFNNGKPSNRDELNNIYRQYKGRISTKEIDKETLLKNLNLSIDTNTEYIDDYKQQKQAEQHNRRVRNIIDGITNELQG